MTVQVTAKCSNCHQRGLALCVVPEYTAEMEYDGKLYSIVVQNLEVYRCEHCANEILPDGSYMRLDGALRVQAGLLLPAQITAGREALHLSQKELAALVGVGPATVARWESGGQLQQRPMNDLLQAFFDLPELRDYLRRKRGILPIEGKPVQPAKTA